MVRIRDRLRSISDEIVLQIHVVAHSWERQALTLHFPVFHRSFPIQRGRNFAPVGLNRTLIPIDVLTPRFLPLSRVCL